MKKLISLLTCIALCISIGFSANASDISDNDVTSSAFYDLEEGGLQEFVLTDSDGNSIYVNIEECDSRAVADNTYKVSASSPSAWNAEYLVTVKNNNIVALSSARIKAIKGSISNSYFKKESSKQSTLYFTWKHLLQSYSQGVRTTLTSTKLKVSIV